uniref:Katanin p80 WD40 repeat-containing subunit B1 n=1 Tax=Geotrypetes seraphini TaxID=260995 RepID=A0A6P8QNX4_GEOSA|nr:katanin p80 WD40 repeat-containing subunit B1 isoform X2 [Geotrypetes seraphini]
MAAPVPTKAAWKLQEIVAHSSSVSAVVLGKNSGRLLATGGDDCRVNLWSVNKPNCVMSLTGHTTPIESVRFNASEDLIVAGSQSGSLRVWDMEAAKILRTLMGHKANITSLDFHPYGEYIASGSMDTNIKLWDIRRKGCVFRYKGHTEAVRCLRFSPDGKWVASSADDCIVKLWDLAAGKMISEFTAHRGPVNIVEFHPNEYLLASGSSDRTIRFWDLEKFQMVSCIEGETSAVRSILFNLDGCCLYSSSQDSLHVYGWEPERCFDVVPVGWGKIADMAICNNQLIGVSFSLTTATSYVVDLNKVKKSGCAVQGPIQDKPSSQVSSLGSSIRRNYERPITSCTKPQRVKQNSESERRSPSSEDDRDERESTAEIQNPDDYNEIFQPKSAISRTPPLNNEPFLAPLEDEPVVKEPVKPNPSTDIATPLPNRGNLDQLQRPPILTSTPIVKAEPSVIPATRNEPIGLKAADFLPAVKNQNQVEVMDEEAMSQIHKGHDTMCVVLTSRYKNLDTVRAVWSTGDIKTSVDSAVAINDLAVVVDLLNIINQKASLWKLDMCTSVLPQIEKLLLSKYESYVQTGCTSLKMILQRFLPLITESLSAPPSVGVDISREERLMKCKMCYKQLQALSSMVKNKAGQSGRHGSAFRELHLLMAGLE